MLKIYILPLPVIEVGQGSDFGKVKLSADIFCFVSIINITQ